MMELSNERVAQIMNEETLQTVELPTLLRSIYSRYMRLYEQYFEDIDALNEEKLAEYLAFSIIPYSIEAYGVSPYNASDRLGKYAGFSGKCVYKDLLMEWFGDA